MKKKFYYNGFVYIWARGISSIFIHDFFVKYQMRKILFPSNRVLSPNSIGGGGYLGLATQNLVKRGLVRAIITLLKGNKYPWLILP